MIKITPTNKELVKIILRQTFPSYRGKKFSIQVLKEPMSLYSYWDGGSKDSYKVYSIENKGSWTPMSMAPFKEENVFKQYIANPNFVLVEHSIFCGKEGGIRFYIHESDLEKFQPVSETI